MRFSRRLINFAKCLCICVVLGALCSCKGRTLENMEPTGDTVEVTVMQQTDNE